MGATQPKGSFRASELDQGVGHGMKWRYSPQLRWTKEKLLGGKQSSVPRAWCSLVASRVIYQLSSVALGFSGCCIVLASPLMYRRVADGWPWISWGCLWILQGMISWLADVVNLGRKSVWHVVDTQFALLNLGLVLLFGFSWGFGVGFGFTSKLTLPKGFLRVFEVAVGLVSLYAKAQSGAASHAKNAELYFCWHAVWHYGISLGLCTCLIDGMI